MIERLVGFDTTSANSNLNLIVFAAEWLESCGARVRLTHDETSQKANLFATLGPYDKAGVILSGHTDVVPVDGQAWSSDPFRLEERSGRLFGRGTADMKGFLGLCLALAPDFAARDLAVPVHFALSYDEEIGCVGVRRLIKDLDHLPVKPALCLVGEPTGMAVIGGHKGKRSVRGTVLGKQGHSALNHRGVNAVEIAAEIVAFLRGLQRRLREQGPFDAGFDPPYSTIHVGSISGGTALNIVPASCRFEFEIRDLPEDDSDALMAEIRAFAVSLVPEMLAVDEASGILLDEYNSTNGLVCRADDPAVRLALTLTGSETVQKVAYTTEAGLFASAGIPSVVCGPGHIAQAHKPDEFIEIEQIRLGEAFLRRLMDAVDAGGAFPGLLKSEREGVASDAE